MIIIKLYQKLFNLIFRILERHKFAYFGKNVRLFNPLFISGKEYIKIEDNVNLNTGIYLAASTQTGNKPELIIGKGSRLGNFNHIYATKKIIIEENVLTAERVYISDNLHSYEDINTPIIKQPIKQINEVIIGAGSWLGENVCIIGASVGKNCVIGANSVVTKDIPDYCVAVGSPAKIIKKYNRAKKRWE